MSRTPRIVVIACLLSFMFPDMANSAKPASKVLPPGGNTIAGPGSFNLAPGTGESVFSIKLTQTEIPQTCVTVVVTSPDALVRLNVKGITTVFISDAASRSLCFDFRTTIEIRCDSLSLEDCLGFWRVDRLP